MVYMAWNQFMNKPQLPRGDEIPRGESRHLWRGNLLESRDFLIVYAFFSPKGILVIFSWSIKQYSKYRNHKARYSCGGKRFPLYKPNLEITHWKHIWEREYLLVPPDLLVHPNMCAPTSRSHREKILWDHEIYSYTLLSRSILIDYVNQTMCASTTCKFYREKILRDHEIYSSIILCVHPPRGGLTVRKSCGTMRYPHDLEIIF